MAIAKPSNILIEVNCSLSQDQGQGRVTNTNIVKESLNFPFSSYVQGSIDITSLSGSTLLGKFGICFLYASQPITVETSDASGISTHVTKMFALNGDATEISISTTSVVPVTVVYVMGSAAV